MGQKDFWCLFGCLMALCSALPDSAFSQDLRVPFEYVPGTYDEYSVIPVSGIGPADDAADDPSALEPEWGPLPRLPPVEEELPWPGAESVLTNPLQSDANPPGALENSTPRMPPGGRMMGGGMMGGGMMSGGSPISARAYWLPKRQLRNQSGTLDVWGNELNLMLPIYRSEQGMWSVQTRIHQMAIDTTTTLPSLNRAFPAELWNINLSLSHFRTLENGWTLGGNVGFGSASDRPFASIREMNASMMAMLGIPSGDRNAWNFSLVYAPMGQLPFPIPGVSYQWRPNDTNGGPTISFKPTWGFP